MAPQGRRHEAVGESGSPCQTAIPTSGPPALADRCTDVREAIARRSAHRPIASARAVFAIGSFSSSTATTSNSRPRMRPSSSLRPASRVSGLPPSGRRSTRMSTSRWLLASPLANDPNRRECGLSATQTAARLGVSRIALSRVLHEHARHAEPGRATGGCWRRHWGCLAGDAGLTSSAAVRRVGRPPATGRHRPARWKGWPSGARHRVPSAPGAARRTIRSQYRVPGPAAPLPSGCVGTP